MHKFKGADGIRGIACLIVLLLHNMASHFGTLVKYTRGVEKYGVWIFFSLSSFLLSYKFINEHLTIKNTLLYFTSRTLRIIPAFIVCAILYYSFGMYELIHLKNILLFQDAYAHMWTIPVEFEFYFLLPLFALGFWHFNSRFGIKSLLMLFILLTALHQYLFPYYLTVESTINLAWYLPIFASGVIAAVIYDSRTININSGLRDLLGICIILFAISLAPGLIQKIYPIDFKVNLVNKFIPLGILFSVFIYLFCDAQGIIGKIVSMKFFRWFGKYSFSIYLYHYFFAFNYKVFTSTPSMSMLFSILFAVAAGVTMYYLIESPCNKIRILVNSKYNQDKNKLREI